MAIGDVDVIDAVVSRVWTAMLAAAYSDVAVGDPPLPSMWHCGFRTILSTMAGVNRFFPFARHACVDLNLAYPAETDIHQGYISNLRTPQGLMEYEAIFEKARSNVLAVWKGLDEALHDGRSDALDQLEDWNLDTGRSVKTDRLVFWKEPA